jgi:hypothetical protein
MYSLSFCPRCRAHVLLPNAAAARLVGRDLLAPVGCGGGWAHARMLNPFPGGVDRLIRSLPLQRCRERGHFRVFGLKEPVGRKVLHLVLVE